MWGTFYRNINTGRKTAGHGPPATGHYFFDFSVVTVTRMGLGSAIRTSGSET